MNHPQLKLKKVTVRPNDFYTEKYEVKDGRKTFATIYKAHWKQAERKPNGMYNVIVNGIGWDKHTFEDAAAQAIEMYELKKNMFR